MTRFGAIHALPPAMPDLLASIRNIFFFIDQKMKSTRKPRGDTELFPTTAINLNPI
jgi:hypothetical protein